jgi:hypothetical protein
MAVVSLHEKWLTKVIDQMPTLFQNWSRNFNLKKTKVMASKKAGNMTENEGYLVLGGGRSQKSKCIYMLQTKSGK